MTHYIQYIDNSYCREISHAVTGKLNPVTWCEIREIEKNKCANYLGIFKVLMNVIVCIAMPFDLT